MRFWIVPLRVSWPLGKPRFDDFKIFRRETVKVASSDEDGPQSLFGDAGNLIAVGKYEPAPANIRQAIESRKFGPSESWPTSAEL